MKPLTVTDSLKLSRDRWQKLTDDNKQEARYRTQHAAISKALAREGKQMLKRHSRPVFQVRGTDIEVHYMQGDWSSTDREIQVLINRAIANLQNH